MSTLVNVLEKMSDEEFFAWEKTNNFGNYIHLYSITLVKGCKRILY